MRKIRVSAVNKPLPKDAFNVFIQKMADLYLENQKGTAPTVPNKN